MKIILSLCAVMMTAIVANAEYMKFVGFQVSFIEGVSVFVTEKGQISHVAAKADVIKRDSADTIIKIGSADIKRDGGYITDIGTIKIKRDSTGDITDIGDLRIKKDAAGVITDIGAANIKRDNAGVVTRVSGDVRVMPVFALKEKTGLKK